ncbi:MAG: patatin-like phospholipase family protein [Deltaproteobacteria bacterium]|jgi:NTE family protein|nr:patatin-like phospholipase family protein [Deltaproteobacteria bacterium]
METPNPELAIVMSGGGARAAYQVGLLQALAERVPDLRVPILTGVSAGAINAAHLANHPDGFAEAIDDLRRLWLGLTTEDVFRTDWWSLFTHVVRSGLQLVSGGHRVPGASRGMVDTKPLRAFLHRSLGADAESGELRGVRENLAAGKLRAVAITSSSYSTGTSMTWVEGAEMIGWRRAHRVGRGCRLSVEHVMASASLPLFFPAVALEGEWHGDGGIRLTAPLSPAIHLGARRILAVSTRHQPPAAQVPATMIDGYPPPAQIAGALLNALFLDQFDGDALRLQRVNELLPSGEERKGVKPIELLMIRPSRDLGSLANAYEAKLPRGFRFLTRGLGTRQTRSNDLLSLIMFQHDYLRDLVALGRADALERIDEVVGFVRGGSFAPRSAGVNNEPDLPRTHAFVETKRQES